MPNQELKKDIIQDPKGQKARWTKKLQQKRKKNFSCCPHFPLQQRQVASDESQGLNLDLPDDCLVSRCEEQKRERNCDIYSAKYNAAIYI